MFLTGLTERKLILTVPRDAPRESSGATANMQMRGVISKPVKPRSSSADLSSTATRAVTACLPGCRFIVPGIPKGRMFRQIDCICEIPVKGG